MPSPFRLLKLLLIQVWATWKGRWTEEEKSLFSYTKELELMELERKAYLLMFLERKGGTLVSKWKEDKAPTLFQAEVWVKLSAVVGNVLHSHHSTAPHHVAVHTYALTT